MPERNYINCQNDKRIMTTRTVHKNTILYANKVNSIDFKECHPRCVGELHRWEGSQKHPYQQRVNIYRYIYIKM